MILAEKITKFEKTLIDEQKFCARIAAIHQDSKDTIKALKEELKDSKERYKKEIKQKLG